jgi:hypothetical protein
VLAIYAPVRHLSRLLVAALFIVGWPASALATRAQDLVLKADGLRDAPDASDESLRRACALYQEAVALEPASVPIHVKLADVAMSIGESATTDRRRWFEIGHNAAERAVALDKDNAHAVFLLAAHRGQLANLQKDLGGLLVPSTLERLLLRVLTLNPRHARALHMMGMLLLKTPGPLRVSLKGSSGDVEKYVLAAIEADPAFSEARLDLAQHYAAHGKIAQARAQAQAVVQMTPPARPRAWREKHRPAAEALLKELATK